MRKLIILLIPLLAACKKDIPPTVTVAEADTIKALPNKFRYETPLCEHVGTFDPSLYTLEQLKATFLLSEGDGPIDKMYVKTRVTAEPEDYFMKDEEELDRQYREGKQFYTYLDYIHTPFWDSIHKQKMKRLDEVYKVLKIEVRAYKDPKVLLNNEFYSHCKEYADVLASNDSLALLNAWEKMAEGKAKERGPEKEEYLKEHYQLLHSKNRLIYARNDVMSYGWYNCANHHIYHGPAKDHFDEFEKLFIKVSTMCDE